MLVGAEVRVAYLVNKYPAASHSFIRREIHAVEAQGTEVFRFSVRPADRGQLPDDKDREELSKTIVLLGFGVVPLLMKALKVLFVHPLRGFRSIQIAFSRSSWHPKDLVRRAAYFAEAALLAEHIKASQIDHIHAHFGTNPATVARIASRIACVSYSFTIHGPDEFDAPRQLDISGKVADSAFCVAISSYGRSQVMRWSAFSEWSRIHVVRCGVEERFLRSQTGNKIPDAPRLCTVARLSAQKGVPLLLSAAAQLMMKGVDFHLTIVGDGEMRDEIEGMIERNGLRNHVWLAGWASSDMVIEHLLNARALVLPSFAEGLPVVIMEALSLERPIITTAVAGIPELVDARCGWLVPAGSVEDLASAMAEALTASPELLSEMGKVGRRRVTEFHDASVNGRQINDLFLAVSNTVD